jgi:Raf kinase inhibitor-like YbhB/YbcL family protein
MVLGYTAHAAPMQLSFYNGTAFPKEFQGDAFVSMRGSWNRRPPSGYEVIRIRFENGSPVRLEPFVTGFLTNQGEHGRLMGNVIANDGSLLFSDDRNGVIHRVSYIGNAPDRSTATTIPADPMREQNKVDEREPLAIETIKGSATKNLAVTASFAGGNPIPAIHSAYEQNVSPAIKWTAGPSGTQSYVLIMEDPDAKSPPSPVVHWIAWNIPKDIMSFPEGIPGIDQIEALQGVRQGANSAGVVGYRGPRPPEGDSAHHYHFQVFAVDCLLGLPLGAGREELLKALQGHALARGEIIGLFARPEKPSKP